MSADFQSDSDVQLILKSRDGDEQAYSELVVRYQSLVCSVAYSGCGDLAVSEDLAQEAFIRAWRKLDGLKDLSKFKAWLCTIVRNLARRSREQSSRNPTNDAVSFDAVSEPASSTADPAENAVSTELQEVVWCALADIPDTYREPMILYYREEQSVAHVAEALDLSQDAVKQRLARGRKMLQQQLAATVQTVLEDSKPTKAFAGAVLLGLSGAKQEAAAAGVTTGAAAVTGQGAAGSFLLNLAQLPLVAWLFKTALDETRSQRERQMMLRHQAMWMLATVPLGIAMFATIPWQLSLPPILSGLVIPGMLFLFYIPMIVSYRRLDRRIQRLREEENTVSPPRMMTTSKLRYILRGCIAVAMCPTIALLCVGDWMGATMSIFAGIVVGLVGSRLANDGPTKTWRAYAISLALVALSGVGVMFLRRDAWLESQLTLMMAMQATVTTQVILTVLAWRKVHGKHAMP